MTAYTAQAVKPPASAYRLSLAVLVLGILLSALSAHWLYNQIKENTEAEFARNVERVAGEVTRRFALPLYGLNAAKGLYETYHQVSANQFSDYIRALDLPRHYPGVRGIGFIQRVPRNDLPRFIQATRDDNNPGFTPHQLQANNAAELYLIKYIQPFAPNQGAQGLDVRSEPVRWAALQQAIDSGLPTLTGAIHLVQDKTRQPGALLYLPVYTMETSLLQTAEQRRAALIGIIYSPLVIAELLHNIPEYTSGRVDIELYDDSHTLRYNNLIFDADGSKLLDSNAANAHNPQDVDARVFIRTIPLTLAGHTMLLRVSSTSHFEASINHYSPWLLFTFGILLSVLFTTLLRQQILGRYRAERLALNMTADLERLALVARNTANAVILTDTQRHITWVNDGFERITGYRHDDVLGKSPGQLLQCERTDPATVLAIRQALNQQRAFKGELLNRTKDGVDYWIEMEIQPRYDANHALIGYMAVESDITERKNTQHRLETALRDNDALLSTLNVHGIIAITDGHRRLIDVNDAYCQITGYSRAALLGESPSIVNSGIHPPAFWRQLWDTLRQEEAWRGEICNRARDGRLYWVDTTIAPFKDAEGRIEKYIAIQFDITQAKTLQINLSIARNQLQRATEVAELGVWSWSMADGSLTFDDTMNAIYAIPPAMQDPQRLYGYWHTLIHPDDVAEVDRTLQATLRAGQGQVCRQVFRIHVNGQERIIESAAVVEYQGIGDTLMLVGINRDITRQRQAEATLQAAKLAAENANHAKSAFLANMSHELRTPLNAILGMLTLLLKSGLTHRQADYATKSEAAARALLHLLNDILDYSKIEAGKMELEAAPFNLYALLQDLAVILASNSHNKPVEVLFDIDPRLPRWLIGDSLRLQQVLINLGGNALKFTEQGEVVLFIRQIAQDGQRATLHFGVRDTGIGIAPEKQRLIFSGFSQAEASITRRFGGTGLGLSISQRFVAMMGGTLQLESEPGKGSLFHFTLTLPLAAEQHSEDEQRRQALLGLHVLMVDDNPTARSLLHQMAQSLGWRVDSVEDGEQALARIAQQQEIGAPYAAVFIDWLMPGLDGWQTIQRLRAALHEKQLPLLVMVTANDRECLLQRSSEEQGLLDGFLLKPVTPLMLLDSVAGALHERQSLTQRAPPPAVPHSGKLLHAVRILVVEDNLNNQQIARELLEDEGAIVSVASHGQEAVDRLKATPQGFDLVLMDLQMPVMDGINATQYIRGHLALHTLPIIAMTANAMVSDRQACLAAGMNDHIGKPFNLRELIQTIQKHLLTPPPALPPAMVPSTPSPLSAPLEQLAQRHGIALRGALARLEGDLTLYHHLLRLFLDELHDFPAMLERHMADNDLAAATRALHSLKGLAAQLGHDALFTQARDGESRLRQVDAGNLTPAIRECVADINALCRRLEPQLRAFSQHLADQLPPEASTAIPAAALPPLHEQVQQLLILLENSDMAALEQMRQLATNPAGGTLGETLTALEAAINRLDFTRAQSLCRDYLANAQRAEKECD
ncbi:CHASE domain-containing protein [Edwardsiella hoshinae]|uniref:histidine kinase n=1 Tax=Edwardsiella hoshinae TaxID=93378 RepID=A0A376DF77_9GAMM|nr:CHASE domain-containing protein [Edwardsiella hoshinae]QPR27298.1 CHASE domain-containing protein [Edwardsiella hoshinae]STC87820.1 Signal transduction histidine-protein kinase BarA [Edwardsiella hoshinae]